MAEPVAVRRRTVVTLLGGLALAGPFRASAQPAARRARIGYLSLGSPASEATRFDALRAGLAALGHVEGRSLVIETRWLDGRPYDQLPALAAELVALDIDVLVTYTTPGVAAAKRATQTIPIVFTTVGDAVAVGLVASLARPGGNVTGSSYFIPELAVKRLALLKEALPSLTRAGVLVNPANASAERVLAALRPAAASLGIALVEAAARTPAELEGAFAALAAPPVGALVVAEDPMLIYNAEAIAAQALRHRIAACGFAELSAAGGLLGYGIDFVAMWRHAATTIDKVLKGARPGELPVEQATQFTLEANLKTAAALGVTLPLPLLGRADRVIE